MPKHLQILPESAISRLYFKKFSGGIPCTPRTERFRASLVHNKYLQQNMSHCLKRNLEVKLHARFISVKNKNSECFLLTPR